MNEHLHTVRTGAFSESDLAWVRAMCRRLGGYLGGLTPTDVGWMDGAEPEFSSIQVGGYSIDLNPYTQGCTSILGTQYTQAYEYVVNVEVQSYSWQDGYDYDMKEIGRYRILGEALCAIYLEEHKAAFYSHAESLYYETYLEEP